jgi:hypothetical protein
MAEPQSRSRQDLEESVRRVLGALERVPAARLGAVAAQVSRATDRSLTRAERRLEKRRREEDEASIPHAFALGVAAVVAASVAIAQPHLFWLLFVAFGFGTGAADTIAKVRRRERRLVEESREKAEGRALPGAVAPEARALLSPPPPAEPEPPLLAAVTAREKRVDGICDRLLSELKGATPLVRELLRKPEETVEALRAASRELARRERDLRRMLTEEEGERLLRERAELASRAEAAPDAVVKSRLSSALEALDAQLAHRAELSTAAARIEAEGTRILYSLESLRAQVLRAFAADAAASEVTRESLKGSLETLSGEIDAVATALEEVHSVGSNVGASAPSAAARAASRQAGTA